MVTEVMTEANLLLQLEPVAERLYDRHLSTTKEWFPHQLVPYSRGRDFAPDYIWSPEDSEIKDPAVRAAVVVNLLTEDNLPYYFQTLDRMFGRSGVWREWSTRWTAEEMRHSIALRDYLTVTRAVDPVALERARMQQVGTGAVPEPESAIDGFVYVALQELATRIAHYRTGEKMTDQSGKTVMKRVGKDENFHYLFYRDLGSAALEIVPSLVLPAIERQVRDFEMPGTGIEGFEEYAKLISLTGILGYNEMLHNVYEPVVYGHWNIQNIGGLSPEAEKSVIKIDKRFKALARAAVKETELREEYQESLRLAS